VTERPRLLIEDWLPIEALGIESRRESAPIPGQFPKLKTLHVWWARRPLAASAGVVLGSLMPTWSPELPKAFPHDPRVATDVAYKRWFFRLCGVWGDPIAAKARIARATAKGVTLGSKAYGYRQAYKNSPNPDDLVLLHRLLEQTWGDLPKVLDPTAGGGSIPYEAARYGLPVTATDLNQVAAVVLRGGIEVTARHGLELSGDLAKWGAILSERCVASLEPFFQKPDLSDNTSYLFSRTVTCPRTGKPVPLAPNWWLNKKEGKEAAVRVLTEREGVVLSAPEFEVLFGREAIDSNPDHGTENGGDGISIWDDLVIDSDYIKAEAQAGRLRSTMYAIAVRVPEGRKKGTRTYRAPTQTDLDAVRLAEAETEHNLAHWVSIGAVPTEAIPFGNDTRPQQYGMDLWRDMFSPRQLLVHARFVEEFHRIVPEVTEAQGPDRARTICGLLGLMQGKALNYDAILASWHATRATMRSVFERHDLSFSWSYAEFEGARELYPWACSQVIEAYDGIAALYAPGSEPYLCDGKTIRGSVSDLEHPVPGPVTVLRANAGNLDAVEPASQTLVCIDPPYYDSVWYGELSNFFGVWEQHTVGRVWPDLMPGGLADVKNEAVMSPARFKQFGRRKNELAGQDYEAKMQAIFAECNRVLRDDGVLSVMFTNTKPKAWDTLGMALLEAGFSIETSWPVNTESQQSLHQAKKNAASSTIMLVCRKRTHGDLGVVFFEDIEAEVRSIAREKAAEFEAAGIVGVDLLLATYGPALAVISRHWPVMSAEVGEDGSARRLRPEEALDAAREEIVALRRNALVGRPIDFDALTDFVVLAWSLFRAAEFPYDEARRLALAVGGNDVGTLVAAKILTKKAGTVVLAKPSDRRRRVVSPVTEGQTSGLPLIDVLHGVMVIAESDGLAAAKAICDRLGLLSDQRFVALVQAMVRAIPRTRVKGKFVRPEAETLDRFCAAYLPDIELPDDELETLFAVDE